MLAGALSLNDLHARLETFINQPNPPITNTLGTEYAGGITFKDVDDEKLILLFPLATDVLS